jgi:hypothetical protein
MAGNKVQIKRSVANSTVTGLANGELAFTQASNTLWIGLPDGSGAASIAGVRNPGILTANQALVANSTSGIDKIIVANAVVTTLTANGSTGSAGDVMFSNGSVAYWAPSGAISVNTAASYTWTNTHTFTETINGTANNALYLNSKAEADLNVNSALTANNSSYLNSKTEADLNVNNALTSNLASYIVANNGLVSNSSGVFVVSGDGLTVNATGVHVVGNTGVTANSSGVFIGQPVATTDNVTFNDITINGNTILGSNASDKVTVNGLLGSDIIPSANGSYSLGNSSMVWKDLYLSGSSLYLGSIKLDETPSGILNVKGGGGGSANLFVSGSVNAASNVANFGTALYSVANGNLGIGNSAPSDKLSVNGTSYLGANVTITGTLVNAASAMIKAADAEISANLTVNGTTKLGDSSSDILSINAVVNTSIMPSANVTYNLGSATMRWLDVNAANVHSVYGKFDGNVEIAGDLTVTGNVTTVNVASVIVSDPMIYLAGNNYSSDLLDIGIAANYYDGQERHTGLFRDHTDGVWKLFYNLTQELSGNNDVDTSDASYRTATLQTYLSSGIEYF